MSVVQKKNVKMTPLSTMRSIVRTKSLWLDSMVRFLLLCNSYSEELLKMSVVQKI